jgi:hypothetical protein
MASRRGFLKALIAVPAAVVAVPSVVATAAAGSPLRDTLEMPPLAPDWHEYGVCLQVTDEVLEDNATLRRHVDNLIHTMNFHTQGMRRDHARLLFTLDAR